MSTFALKIIAAATMLLDHIGYGFYSFLPNEVYIILRSIGRLAMPIFCFLIAEGFRHTKCRKKYAIRLFCFALISEIPFDMFFRHAYFDWGYQNVGFTLLLGFMAVWSYDELKRRGYAWMGIPCVIAAMTLAFFIDCDYTFIGVLYIFVFYLFDESKVKKSAFFLIAVAVSIFYGLYDGGSVQFALIKIASSAALIPILLYNGDGGPRSAVVKTGFYAFYPVHLLVLYLIRM